MQLLCQLHSFNFYNEDSILYIIMLDESRVEKVLTSCIWKIFQAKIIPIEKFRIIQWSSNKIQNYQMKEIIFKSGLGMRTQKWKYLIYHVTFENFEISVV